MRYLKLSFPPTMASGVCQLQPHAAAQTTYDVSKSDCWLEDGVQRDLARFNTATGKRSFAELLFSLQVHHCIQDTFVYKVERV
jgi:hypothetical protein